MLRLFAYMLLIHCVLCSSSLDARSKTESAGEPSDASVVAIEFVRGFILWQPTDDASWLRLKAGVLIPMQGRVAIGVGAALVVQIGPRRHAFETAGIYELATGERSDYAPRPDDPSGIKSMQPAKE